jgi:hypothetical protein
MNIVRGVLCGTLQVRSTAGQGTVFDLRFPKVTPMVNNPNWVGAGLDDFRQSVMQSIREPLDFKG